MQTYNPTNEDVPIAKRMKPVPDGDWYSRYDVDAAAAFTREHEHKIEEVEEEVEIIGADAVNGALGMGHVYERVHLKLQAELTALRKGMKP